MAQTKVIFLGGASCSGKSTLASALSKNETADSEASITVLPLDRFYRDLSHLEWEERDRANFDLLEALDIEEAEVAFRSLRGGLSAWLPRYNYGEHIREEGLDELPSGRVLVVEGMYALSLAKLWASDGLRMLVYAPTSLRLARRIARDESFGFDRPRILREWSTHTEVEYQRNRATWVREADAVVSGAKGPETGRRLRTLLQP